MKVLTNKILILRQQASEKHGDLYLPEQHVEKPSRGVVVSAGPKSTVKKDDVIQFGKYAGTDVQVGVAKYVVISEDDVLIVE
jgi:chaperonin GroES